MKFLVLAASLAFSALPALAQQTPDPNITIKMPLSQWNVVMNALQVMPYKDSAPVISEIQTQAKPQIAPPENEKPKK